MAGEVININPDRYYKRVAEDIIEATAGAIFYALSGAETVEIVAQILKESFGSNLFVNSVTEM